MIVYKFRETDRVFDGAVEVPDAPSIPVYHTRTPPPEQEGFYAVMENGWVLVEGVAPPPPEPSPPPVPDYAGIARVARNVELADTDWTQLADSPVDKAAWAAYRQALRDLPAQPGFPIDIQWPVKPE